MTKAKLFPKYGFPIGWGLRIHLGFIFSQLKSGFWFFFLSKGKYPVMDEVLWLWPWKRRVKDNSIWHGAKYKWLSILAGGGFNSLNEISQFWNEYDQAEIQRGNG